jgi:hypothetical protein
MDFDAIALDKPVVARQLGTHHITSPMNCVPQRV